MAFVWPARPDVLEQLNALKIKYHPKLVDVPIVVELSDAKPFKNNRLNLGNVRKFSKAHKIWQKGDFDFCITLIGEVWAEVLKGEQHDALLDLHLTRIEPVYIPQVVIENKKKIICKDDFGRIILSEEQKLDKNGEPCWRVLPIDIGVLTKNARRFGFWFEDLAAIRDTALDLEAKNIGENEIATNENQNSL